ncbi:MAG: nucleotide sugar dehydrogenase [Deltaproteobacteria bacterium]
MSNDSINSVAVIGLGYAGLPVAVAFAEKGVRVVGVDIDKNKVRSLAEGRSYVEDISDADIKMCLAHLRPTDDFSEIADVDAVIICVPTPLNKTREPDISYIISASRSVAAHLRRGMIIVLESTTYPGTTEEVLKPMFEEGGLSVGRDVFLAFSPERVDPGNKRFNVKNTAKVVGGVTDACTQRAASLYAMICDRVVTVSSASAAESVKLLENTYRIVNIGLVNEIAQLCGRMKLNIWEIIEAASTKPYGFMPFYPGPGIGGHCIGIDPIYLSWKAKLFNFRTRFIELADEINNKMPEYVISRLFEVLNERGRSIRNSNILLLGVAYKRDIGDIRESPALEVIKHLVELGACVSVNDPYVPEFHHLDRTWRSEELTEGLLKAADCVVITTDHGAYDWGWIVARSNAVLDTRNATKAVSSDIIRKL